MWNDDEEQDNDDHDDDDDDDALTNDELVFGDWSQFHALLIVS